MEPEEFDWKNIQSVFVMDDLYEHINAPQWVDFSSAPSFIDQPDDHLWFCRPECNHPKTAQDFLKQLPCLNKSASCREVSDSNPNRRRMLKKGSSDCENHNPNRSTTPSPSKQHKISSKNLFTGDWPITEFYNDFKNKLVIRTKPEEERKPPLVLDDSVDEKLLLPHKKARSILLVKRRDDEENKPNNPPQCFPHQNKPKRHSSSRTATLQQVGRRGILQELEEESTNVKGVVNGDHGRKKKEKRSLDFFWFLKPCTFPSSS